MNDTTVAYLISCAIVLLALERFMRVFFDTLKSSRYIASVTYLVCLSVNCILCFTWNTPIVTLTTNLVLYFVITLNYISTYLRRVVASISAILFLGVADALLILVLRVLNVTQQNGVDNEGSYLVVAIALGTFLLAALIQRFKNIRKSSITSPVYWATALFIPTSSVFLVTLVLLSQDIHRLTVILSVLTVLLVNYLVFHMYDALSATYGYKLLSSIHAKEKEYYLSQSQLIQESLVKMKSFRHDIKNHFTAMLALSDAGGLENIKSYLYSLVEDIGKSEIYCDTGNLAFDSIINYKLGDINKKGIKLSIDMLIPRTLSIDNADVVSMLGNLLDNALEAVDKLGDKWITLKVEHDKGILRLNIKNPFLGEVRFRNGKNGKIDGIVSSKNGKVRGYGLMNVLNSVKRYNGRVSFSYANSVFSVFIMLFVE